MKNNPFPIQQINTLDLKIDENGCAFSNNYSDIYFQAGIGLDEKRHVFLAGNDLPQNWQDKDSFVIAETGFGTGLNFLMTWQAWEANQGDCKRLDFISCELHPMDQSQLAQALAVFPELAHYSKQLIEKYPKKLVYGIHRIEFASENIVLTLIFADAANAYQQLNASVDAWYLDGFGPNKNPDMWSELLVLAIAKLSHINTTAATFTVARKIRDGLSHVGFEINKVEGFGQKREMLKACFQDENKKPVDKQPWAQTFAATKKNNITIIGAGIAGLTLACNLNKKAENVTLIDRHKTACSETSGNPQAMVMPMFSLNDSKEARFYLRAFLYASNYYDKQYFHQDGVLQLAINEKQQHWQQKLIKQFNLPNSLICKHENGLLYPNSGWLDSHAQAQKQMEKIENYIQAEVNRIEFINHQWHLFADDRLIHKTDVLILANGIHCLKLLTNYEIPIIPKQGQISYFKSDLQLKISQCKQVVLHKGYITPSCNGVQTLGATFDHLIHDKWFDPPICYENHWQRNINMWKGTEQYKELSCINSSKTRAGIRVTTPDHLPICGAVVNQNKFKLI
jgi:tRNA 5-methylaminomethyl-2-thiouridine biosynthesis bifunctional protein